MAKFAVLGHGVVGSGTVELFLKNKEQINKKSNIDFTTYQSGNKYRVYNVAVEGASLVTVYRNQFGETIKAKGIDGLIADLKVKNGSK